MLGIIRKLLGGQEPEYQQEINIWSLPPGAPSQRVNVNPSPGDKQPDSWQYPAPAPRAVDPLALILALGVVGFLLLAGCALITGSIW